jgi:molybdenum cofactor cytidylyltransferase
VNVAAVILAAGSSSRFEDGQKLLAEIDGVAIVRRVCSAVARSNVSDIVLVVAASDGAVTRAAGHGRWRPAENAGAVQGLSASLRVGLQHIGQNADGVLIVLADMPGISGGLVDELIAAFAESEGRAIVFPLSLEGRRGHPIIWPRDLIAALEAVSGDQGGKAVLARYPERWRPIPCEDAGAFADIDTRDDLTAFRSANIDDADLSEDLPSQPPMTLDGSKSS